MLPASPAPARNGRDTPAPAVTVRGACLHLVVRGEDVTETCAGRLVDTPRAGGGTGFSFFSDRESIDFVGGHSAPDGDRLVLPLDTIVVARSDRPGPPHPRALRAHGSCTYFAEDAIVACGGHTARGEFLALFRSAVDPPGGTRAK